MHRYHNYRPALWIKIYGARWDYDVPSIEIWRECLRVLKPGGTALIFAGSRTQHRMAVNVEDAGFILKDCIMWIYGSGFPKASDISKQIDKKAGEKRKISGYEERFGREGRKANCGFKKEYIGASGTQDQPAMKAIEEPVTPEAILWNGWKSHGLKPAYEPILVCIKPNEGSYANNALKWGVAGLNIDGGRIGNIGYTNGGKNLSVAFGRGNGETKQPRCNGIKGRFPANIILDEEAGNMLDEQSGERKSAGNYKNIEMAKQCFRNNFNSPSCYLTIFWDIIYAYVISF